MLRVAMKQNDAAEQSNTDEQSNIIEQNNTMEKSSIMKQDNATDPNEINEEQDLQSILQTPSGDVFHIIHDKQTYILPASLKGVPVARITETSEYWDPSWASLDAYLAREKEEENLKAESSVRRLTEPSEFNEKEYKRHSDNVSKQRKIREIFSNDRHPNQLVSKHHMPEGGLCEQELMYKVACKISDLYVLHQKGQLAMDPWDFIRWRIALKLESLLHPLESGRHLIKRVILNLADDNGNGASSKYQDHVFRRIILYSAGLQGNKLRYGSKKSTKSKPKSRKVIGGRGSSIRRPEARSASNPPSSSLSSSRGLGGTYLASNAPSSSLSSSRRPEGAHLASNAYSFSSSSSRAPEARLASNAPPSSSSSERIQKKRATSAQPIWGGVNAYRNKKQK